MSHVVLVASDHLGYRVLERLQRDGHSVGLLAPAGSWLAEAELPAGLEVVRGRPAERRHLDAAGLGRADALLAITDRDDTNLAVALCAREARANLRLVVRQFDPRVSQLVATQLGHCEAFGVSALAAPTFTLAALGPGIVYAHDLGGGSVVVRECRLEEGRPEPSERVVAVAGSSNDVSWLPSEPPAAGRGLVIGDGRALPPHPAAASHVPLSPPPDPDPNRRVLAGVLIALALLVSGSALFFHAHLGLTPIDAVYFVVTIVTSVGFGDFNLRDADTVAKLVGMLLMFSGVMLSAALFGLVTNILLARQQRSQHGHIRARLSGHVVVCGLGNVGLRVCQALRARGQEVVALEANENGRFVGEARRLGVRVVVGDARRDAGLAWAGLDTARSLVIATGHDDLNLEIALHARGLVDGLPLVLRLFDPELAHRLAARFGRVQAFSTAALGAARFASAAAGERRLVGLSFAGRAWSLRLDSPGIRGPGHPLAAVSSAGRLDLSTGAALASTGSCLYLEVDEP